jgi:hypothetical protein
MSQIDALIRKADENIEAAEFYTAAKEYLASQDATS